MISSLFQRIPKTFFFREWYKLVPCCGFLLEKKMCSDDDGNGLTHDFILGQNYVYGYHGPPFDVRYSDFF